MANLTGDDISNHGKLNTDKVGTAALPAVTIGGDANSGIYGAADSVKVATGGSDRLTVDSTGITVVGSVVIGSAAMAETDLEKLDGITNGTAAASKAVVLDASSDIDTFDFTGGVGLGLATLGLVKVQQTVITAAELKALAATPITIVSAPATGYYNVPVAVLLELNNATDYDDAAADGNLVVRYTDLNGATWAFLEADAFIDSAADDVRVITGPNDSVTGANSLAMTPVINAVIVLDNDGAEYTTGTGTLDVTVYYVELKSQL